MCLLFTSPPAAAGTSGRRVRRGRESVCVCKCAREAIFLKFISLSSHAFIQTSTSYQSGLVIQFEVVRKFHHL